MRISVHSIHPFKSYITYFSRCLNILQAEYFISTNHGNIRTYPPLNNFQEIILHMTHFYESTLWNLASNFSISSIVHLNHSLSHAFLSLACMTQKSFCRQQLQHVISACLSFALLLISCWKFSVDWSLTTLSSFSYYKSPLGSVENMRRKLEKAKIYTVQPYQSTWSVYVFYHQTSSGILTPKKAIKRLTYWFGLQKPSRILHSIPFNRFFSSLGWLSPECILLVQPLPPLHTKSS